MGKHSKNNRRNNEGLRISHKGLPVNKKLKVKLRTTNKEIKLNLG